MYECECVGGGEGTQKLSMQHIVLPDHILCITDTDLAATAISRLVRHIAWPFLLEYKISRYVLPPFSERWAAH